ncbi:hypothetical protein CH373_09090 [Leptospira perolatii]|uniref:NnrU domain-containing protein n=1 Tax=Leptospira perolatii TaxID=2023191 RepID=A0A2M9ZNI7_9LEPT|nr:NnrU family protein [Leptospira perolatii]PJZ69645.1 hypothetical protein CH360_10235 [Leptospira perolatii]PJZ73632.1 hypothetical protein CH373_09090 [Leptospira perolatii]
MKRFFVLMYAVLAYFCTLIISVLLLGFADNLPYFPYSVDEGPQTSWVYGVVFDLGLLLLFGLQHSLMARARAKKIITRWIPSAAERSTYLVFSVIALWLLFRFWQPIPYLVWSINVETMWLRWVVLCLNLFGWGLAIFSTFQIDHFELFGLKQTWANFKGQNIQKTEYKNPFLYKYVRHPMMTGFLLGIWMVSDMSAGHFLFSIVITVYIWIGTYFEEKDLLKEFGSEYKTAQTKIGKFFPKIFE